MPTRAFSVTAADAPTRAVDWPLTEAQAGLWYAQRLAPDNPAFNVAHALWIEGALDVDALRAAANRAVRESPALALRMVDGPDGPRQFLDDQHVPELETVDLRAEADPDTAARAAMARDRLTPVDPTRDRIAAQRLYVLGEGRWVFYVRVHHLVIDGYGMALLTDRLCNRYAAMLSRQDQADEPLSELEPVFFEDADYVRSGKRVKDAVYWRALMEGAPAAAGLGDGDAPAAFECHRHVVAIDEALRHRILRTAQQIAQPWPDMLTAFCGEYCRRMTGQQEAVVGVPFMGRLGRASARVPAMVMNVLPLRVPARPGVAMADAVQMTARDLIRARRHGRYRGEQVRRDLGLVGGQRRLHGPLINMQPFYQPPILGEAVIGLEILSTGPVDDVTFGFRGEGRVRLDLEIEANPRLYGAAAVAAHAERLLAFVADACEARTLDDVPLASRAEAGRVVNEFNATRHPVPDSSLKALLETAMAATPDASAVEFGDERLSYSELELRSRALALQLQTWGVGRESIVAVALPRSIERVVALVAILRAGGAYLPLESGHPDERLSRVMASAKPAAVLAEPADANRLKAMMGLPGRVGPDEPATQPPGVATQSAIPARSEAATMSARCVLVPDEWNRTADKALGVEVEPKDAAYIIYTSGSTGEPKGVVIEHRAIVNRLEWMRSHYNIDASDRILHKTPISFDVSVWEFFLPLIAGATLVVAPPGAHRDPRALVDLIKTHDITTLHFVPSMLRVFLATPEARNLNVRRVFVSGETLGAELRERFHATVNSELHNLYGPTEAAVDVSFWPAGPSDRTQPVPIGFPVWNTVLDVLDERLRPLPPGVAGDLYIGGAQLARGYLGRSDLTAERFIDDPHRPGERLYRTGDLARWRPDGALEFLGRSDHQVKLRGLRIELGEIEAAITELDPVVRAVVIVREDRPGEQRLVAYVEVSAHIANGESVVNASGSDAKASGDHVSSMNVGAASGARNAGGSEGEAASAQLAATVRQHVASRVPDYMVPTAFVLIDAWPVTVNGKLDRNALPLPERDGGVGRPPASDTERALALLFASALGVEHVAVDADFFTLGGDSLSAVRLLLDIQKRFGGDPGLGALFATPTVAAIAARLDDVVAMEPDHGLAPLIRLAQGDAVLAPLFAVHPAGGISWCYRELARALSPQRDVHGLQSPALDPARPLPDSIDALARDYVHHVAVVQPSGPVHLIGWSVGGVIAQAMAVHLREIGREVGVVALLDAYPAECWRDEPEPDPITALRALLAVAGYDPDAHTELASREAIVDFLRRGNSTLGNLPDPVLDGVVRSVTDTNRLVRAHHHRYFDGTLLHLRAGNDHAEAVHLQASLWGAHASRIDAVELPYRHSELTGRDASAEVAPLLDARLRLSDDYS